MRRTPALLLHFALPIPHAAADLVYTSQIRTLRAEAHATASGPGAPGATIVTAAAPDFAPWAADITASDGVFNPPNPNELFAIGRASMVSSLNPGSFTLSGLVAGSDSVDAAPNVGFAAGTAHFEVAFTLAAPAPYALTGNVEFINYGAVNLALRRGGQTVYAASGFQPSYQSAGTLEPGDYTFTFDFFGGVPGSSTGSASATYLMSLVIPAPTTLAAAALLLLPATAPRRRCDLLRGTACPTAATM